MITPLFTTITDRFAADIDGAVIVPVTVNIIFFQAADLNVIRRIVQVTLSDEAGGAGMLFRDGFLQGGDAGENPHRLKGHGNAAEIRTVFNLDTGGRRRICWGSEIPNREKVSYAFAAAFS